MASNTDVSEFGNDCQITVDKYTNFPAKAWDRIRVKSKHENILPKERLDVNTPVSPDHVRVVCLSDTHTKLELQDPSIVPHGDILLHAGDFTMKGEPEAVDRFNTFLGKLPHKHKIVIAGNHEISFDDFIMDKALDPMFGTIEKYSSQMRKLRVKNVKEILTNCIYLEDNMVSLYGINIYGSPWQPAFGGWGFNLVRGDDLLKVWSAIPTETDILMTHGPPVGYNDNAQLGGKHVGCVELLNIIQKKVKPKYHVFGHIHEGYGMSTDGVTTFINASTCTTRYRPTNPAIAFDYPLPDGHSKEELPIVHPKVNFEGPDHRMKKFSLKSRLKSVMIQDKKCV